MMGTYRCCKLFVVLGVLIGLATAQVYAQEINLDAAEPCGDMQCYQSLDDANVYYYLPDQPRIAVKDGKPQFSFLKYARIQRAKKAGTGRAGGGGIVHFLVTYGATKSRVTEAQAALQEKYPDATIKGPIIYRKGAFALVTSFQENNKRHTRTLAVGKAPLMEGQKTAVSLALTPEGAELLWESFKSATPDISLVFDMEFVGIREPYEATLEADWSRISKHHQVSAGVKYAWFGADVDILFQELRQTGAVKITTKGESKVMDSILQSANSKLLKVMFDPTPADELTKLRAEKKYDNLNEAMKLLKMNKKGASLDLFRPEFQQLALKSPWYHAYVPDLVGLAYADSKAVAKQHFEQGEKFYAQKNYREALKAYKMALDAYEGAAAADRGILLYDIGQCYYFLNDYANAKENYLEAENLLEKDEHKALNYLSLTRVYMAQNNTEAAIGTVNNGISIAKGGVHASLIFYRGKLFQGASEYVKAAIDFAYVVEILGKENPDANEYRQAKRLLVEMSTKAYHQARRLDDQARAAKYAPDATEKALTAYKHLIQFTKLTDQRRKEVDARIAFLTKKMETSNVAKAGPGDGDHKDTPNQGALKGATKPPQKDAGKLADKDARDLDKAMKEGLGKSSKSNKVAGKQKPTVSSPGKQEPKSGAKPKSNSRSKAKPKVRKDKTPGFSLVASYKMRRIKRSGRLVYKMNHMRSEPQSFVMVENIGDLYRSWGRDPRIFRAVTIDDPVFKQRDIAVTLDGQDFSSFSKYMNFVTVKLRKRHDGGHVTRDEVVITPELFNRSGNHFMLQYGWHDDNSHDRWLNYEYEANWSFHGGKEIGTGWLQGSDAMLALAPPHRYRAITFEADGRRLQDADVRHAVITVNSDLQGKAVTQTVTVRNRGDFPVAHLVVPQQEDKAPQVQITWYMKGGKTVKGAPQSLQGDIVYWDELP